MSSATLQKLSTSLHEGNSNARWWKEKICKALTNATSHTSDIEDGETERLEYGERHLQEDREDGPADEYAGQNEDWVTIAMRQLGGMLIIVFVRRPLAKYVEDIETSALGMGTMGAGNKGRNLQLLTFELQNAPSLLCKS